MSSDVFSPFYARRDSTLYDIPELGRSARVLDAGCGTGILAKEWARRYPDVSIDCVDIVKDAVEVAKANLHEIINQEGSTRHVRLYEGDLSKPNEWKAVTAGPNPIPRAWDGIPYDLIVHNPGHISQLKPQAENRLPEIPLHHRHAVFDKDHAHLSRFLETSHRLLSENGSLILTSSTLGDLGNVLRLLKQNQWHWEVSAVQSMFDDGRFGEYMGWSAHAQDHPLWFTFRCRHAPHDTPSDPGDVVNNHRYVLGRIADEYSRVTRSEILREWVEQCELWTSESLLPQLGQFLEDEDWIISVMSYPGPENEGRLEDGIHYRHRTAVTAAHDQVKERCLAEQDAMQLGVPNDQQLTRFLNYPSRISDVELRLNSDGEPSSMTFWPIADRLQVILDPHSLPDTPEQCANLAFTLIEHAAVGRDLDEAHNPTEHQKWNSIDKAALRNVVGTCIHYFQHLMRQQRVSKVAFLRISKFYDWSAGSRRTKPIAADGDNPQLNHGGCIFITSLDPWTKPVAQFEGLFRNLAQLFAQINLAITASIRRWRREVVASRNGVSRIMLRNLAHHIGSHVLSRTRVEDVRRRFLEWRNGKEIRKLDEAVATATNRLLSYVESRSVFMAELVTRSTSLIRRRAFLADVVGPFCANTLLIDGLTASRSIGYQTPFTSRTAVRVYLRRGKRGWKQLRYGANKCADCGARTPAAHKRNQDWLPYDGMCAKGDHRSGPTPHADLEIAIPGANGPHAIFLILENVIRNSCRHQPRTEDPEINIRIDVTEHPEHFTVRVYDEDVPESAWTEIRSMYQQPYTDDSIGEPRRQGRGALEIKAMSHFLSGAPDWDTGSKAFEDCDVLRDDRSDGKKSFAYTFRLRKPVLAFLVDFPQRDDAADTPTSSSVAVRFIRSDRLRIYLEEGADFLIVHLTRDTAKRLATRSRSFGFRHILTADDADLEALCEEWERSGGSNYVRASHAEIDRLIGSGQDTKSCAAGLWALWLGELADAELAVTLDDADNSERVYHSDDRNDDYYVGIGRHGVSIPDDYPGEWSIESVSADSEDYRIAHDSFQRRAEGLAVWGRFIEGALRKVIVLDERCSDHAGRPISEQSMKVDFGAGFASLIAKKLGLYSSLPGDIESWPTWTREAMANLYLVTQFRSDYGSGEPRTWNSRGGDSDDLELQLRVRFEEQESAGDANRTELRTINLHSRINLEKKALPALYGVIAIDRGSILVAHQSLFDEVFGVDGDLDRARQTLDMLTKMGIFVVLVSGQGSLTSLYEQCGYRYAAWSSLAPLLTDRNASKVSLVATLVSATGSRS